MILLGILKVYSQKNDGLSIHLMRFFPSIYAQEYVRRPGTEPMAKQRQRFDRDQNATQVLGDQTAGVQETGQERRRVHSGLGRRTRR